MEKKRLLLISPTFHQGGLERICVSTARILEPYFHVTVAAFDLKDAVYDLQGLDVRDLRLPAVPGRLGKALNLVRRAFRLRRLKKELGTDISYGFGATANKANALSGGPGQVWCSLHSFLDLDGGLFLPFVVRRSQRVICCSRAIAAEIEKRYRCGKTVTIYNPYDREEILAGAAGKAEGMPDWRGCRVVFTVGRADDVKGYWHLLKAFALLYRNRPDARLMFVGSGDFSPYRKLAEDLGVGEAVCFAGLQKNPFPWMAAGDLFVLTSRNEGFPNVMVEAMTLGKPVIAVNCPSGPAEILTDHPEEMAALAGPVNEGYGILIPAMPFEKNMDAGDFCAQERLLAEQMERLLADEGACRRLGEAAKKRAALYSGEAYVEAFLRCSR